MTDHENDPAQNLRLLKFFVGMAIIFGLLGTFVSPWLLIPGAPFAFFALLYHESVTFDRIEERDD